MILSYRDLHKAIFKHNYVIYLYWKSDNVLPITCSVWVGTDEGFVVAIELEELTCDVIPDVRVLGMAVVWLFTVSAAFDKNLSFKNYFSVLKRYACSSANLLKPLKHIYVKWWVKKANMILIPMHATKQPHVKSMIYRASNETDTYNDILTYIHKTMAFSYGTLLK